MNYLLDTIAVIRYLSNTGKISAKVKTIFNKAENGENKLFISTISFMEIMYLAEKNRIPITLEIVIEKIRISSIYKIVNLSIDIILTAKTVEFHELHDRLILATAKYFDIPIISSDLKFKEVSNIEVIW